ncbi:MAG TPA: EVE domain-containing protein, partial [Bacteroidetes bacterium]|nr:EVE domain-containing protein [Bacteroidota bacterium]
DDPDNPRWVMVDVQAVQAVDPPVTLDEIKKTPELQNMVLVNNSRLSVQPVQPEEWRFILSMRGISL